MFLHFPSGISAAPGWLFAQATARGESKSVALTSAPTETLA